jgi:hypothetical protein
MVYRDKEPKSKFKENYFYETISYASEYGHKQLINEQKNILAELKSKDEFLKNYNKDIEKIIKLYSHYSQFFEEAERFLKSRLRIDKFYETGFFKKKEKVDLQISNEDLNEFLSILNKAFVSLFEAFYQNRLIITKGLYTKITFNFYKLTPTGEYYNLRMKLDSEEEEGSIPKQLLNEQLSAMGDRKYTDRMFQIIPPGLGIFNVIQVSESKDFMIGGVYKTESGEYDSKPGVFYKYEDFYSDRAIKILIKLAKGIEDIGKGFGPPYRPVSVPKKEYYKKLFDEEKVIRLKQLRKIELYIRSKEDQIKKEEGVGYVYVAKSIGYPGMYKIGSTYGNPKKRVEDLSGTNVPDPWTLAEKIKIKDAEYYEKLIHKLLSKYRYRKGREFFKLDLDKIKMCLKQVSQISEKGSKKLTLAKIQKEIKL